MSEENTRMNGTAAQHALALETHKNETIEEYRQWVDSGYDGSLLPLLFGQKFLTEKKWTSKRWMHDEVEHSVLKGANVGLRLDNHVALDIEDTPIGDALFDQLREKYPDAPIRRRPGSKSRALLFAMDGAVSSVKIKEPGAHGRTFFELLAGRKKQLHIIGHRSDSNDVRLEWDGFKPHAFLPSIDAIAADALISDVVNILQSAGLNYVVASPGATDHFDDDAPGDAQEFVDEATLSGALDSIENGDWCADYETWQSLAYAVARLSGGNAEIQDQFLSWSTPAKKQGTNTETHTIFRQARAGQIRTPPREAAVTVANALLEHAALKDGRPRAIAYEILNAPLILQELLDLLPPIALSVGVIASTTSIEDKWRLAMQELKAARFEAGQDLKYLGSESTDCLVDLTKTVATPRMRPDISDRHARMEITLTAADGGVGKSTLSLLFAFALALNKPELVGLKKFDWLGDVVMVSNEDGAQAIHRMITALEAFYAVNKSDYQYSLFVWKEDQLSITQNTGSTIAPSPDAFSLAQRLTALRKEKSIALVVIDTLASATEGSDENAVKDMGVAMRVARELARSAFCSVELIHHKKKGATLGRALATDSRGSGAISASVRSQIDLSKVDVEDQDVQDFGWTEEICERRIRLAGTKANGRALARKQFFEFISVSIPVEDPRTPDALFTQEVGVLKHVPTPKDGSGMARAYRALVVARDEGVNPIYTGGARGPGAPDTAKTIIAKAMRVAPATAHKYVEKLIEEGWIASEERTINKRKKSVVRLLKSDEGEDNLSQEGTNWVA